MLAAVSIAWVLLVSLKLEGLLEQKFPPVFKDSRLGQFKSGAWEWVVKLVGYGVYGFVAWILYSVFIED